MADSILSGFLWGKIITLPIGSRQDRGNAVVSWSIELPETGSYDVLTYTQEPRTFSDPGYYEDRFLVPKYDMSYSSCGTVSRRSLYMGTGVGSGWTYLGTFDFELGPATVVLTNASGGKIVYADAVKLGQEIKIRRAYRTRRLIECLRGSVLCFFKEIGHFPAACDHTL